MLMKNHFQRKSEGTGLSWPQMKSTHCFLQVKRMYSPLIRLSIWGLSTIYVKLTLLTIWLTMVEKVRVSLLDWCPLGGMPDFKIFRFFSTNFLKLELAVFSVIKVWVSNLRRIPNYRRSLFDFEFQPPQQPVTSDADLFKAQLDRQLSSDLEEWLLFL